MIRSLSIAALVAIPVSLRSTVAPDNLVLTLARRITRRIALALVAARRAMRVENDVTRNALMRDGFSVGQESPRTLGPAGYDVLRQIR
jgi:hypothetical protein